MNSTQDPFPGVWELDPETLDYQFGRPGRRAIYTIEVAPSGLIFTLDGEDADGKPMKLTYGGELDGRDHPLPGADVVLILRREGEQMIESLLKRSGRVVDRWAREILPDRNTMKITQHGVTPNGQRFQNTSIYRRIK